MASSTFPGDREREGEGGGVKEGGKERGDHGWNGSGRLETCK